MAPRAGPTVSPTAIVVLLALLIGLSASFLLAAPQATTGVNVVPGYTPAPIPNWLPIFLMIGLFVGTILVLVLRRFLQRSETNFPIALGAATALLVGLMVYALLRSVAPPEAHNATAPASTGHGTAGGCTAANATSCSTPPPGGLGSGAVLPTPSATETDLVYIVLIAAAVLAVFLVPRLRRALADEEEGTGGGGDAPADELRAALGRLVSVGPTDDARTRIIRAYGDLLAHARRGLRPIETATPRELEQDLTAVYRVTPETARTLTALFEEARYSRERPLAPDAVGRAEAALTQALSEIDRAPRGAR